VGRVLGEAGINISRMQLALVRERNEAAMLVNVDTSPPEPVLEELRNLPHMIAAQLVELEGAAGGHARRGRRPVG
jgi:hypothetical protein